MKECANQCPLIQNGLVAHDLLTDQVGALDAATAIMEGLTDQLEARDSTERTIYEQAERAVQASTTLDEELNALRRRSANAKVYTAHKLVLVGLGQITLKVGMSRRATLTTDLTLVDALTQAAADCPGPSAGGGCNAPQAVRAQLRTATEAAVTTLNNIYPIGQ